MSKETETPVEESTPAEPQATGEGEETTSPNREAAKYRRQLRETESARDELAAQLTAARSELLRGAVTGYRVNGNEFNIDALEDAGINVDEVFTDGKLNPDAIAATMTGLAESKPFMFTAPQRMIVPGEGKAPSNQTMGNPWEGAFAPKQ